MDGHPEQQGTLKYQLIATTLRERIRSGSYLPGDQLPTKAALMQEFSASLNTVDKAVGFLRSDGLVEVLHGVGMFVRAVPSPGGGTPLAEEVADLRTRVAALEAQVENLCSNAGIAWSAATGEADQAAEDAV